MGRSKKATMGMAGEQSPPVNRSLWVKISTSWFGPAIVSCVFMAIFCTVLWLIQADSYRLKRMELVDEAESAAEIIRMRLAGNRDYLLLLAKERGNGTLSAESFQLRASRYVADHPELINITWVDARFYVHDVAPLVANRQILGLHIDLPEPKRVSHLAMERRQPVYTRPFEAIQGKTSFEIWVPVFHGDTFVGLFAGVYSCEQIMQHLITEHAQVKHRFSCVDSSGQLLWAMPATNSPDRGLSHRVQLTPEESGVFLQVNGYGRGTLEWRLLLLELLCLALVLGMAGAMWGMKREVDTRRSAEETLQRERALLRCVIDSAKDLIYIKDRDGIYRGCNKASEIFVGLPEDEQIGKSDFDFFDQETAEGIRENDRQVIEAGKTYRAEEWGTYPDGRRVLLDTMKVPYYGAEGEILGLVGISRDMTDRWRMTEALQESEERLRLTMDSIGIGIWDWDLQEDRWYVSPVYYTMLGYEPRLGAADRSEWLERVHPDDRAAVADKITDVLLTDFMEYKYEARLRHADGTYRWQQVQGVCIKRDLEGKVTRMLGIRMDIDERKRAEEELMKLVIAVEQSPVSIVITDTTGAIEFVNPKFTQLTGYESAELLGRNTRILKSGETPPETYRTLWSAISSGKVWHGEFHNRKKNGEPFLENATIAPVKNSQGVITSYIAIKEDITDRRNLENQLRQSQKMEAIGTLAGGIAHDFNNILTAIIGFGSLLEIKLAKDDPLIAYAGQILAAADRAANLTRSLLAFSRNQPIATKVVDLGAIVTGLEKMLHRLIREDIELVIVPSGKPLPVLVDAGQIDQVLINLATNARDAMPGGGRLTITIDETFLDEEFKKVHGYGASGGYAKLVVADSGEGMAENVRQRIFDPFFTTKEVGKGTGLGLSVCYGIIKQHDGYINCYSEPGRGTTFRIYLPLVHGELEEAAPATVSLPAGGTETILLAEDDPAVRSLTSDLLREFGYVVIEACDGEEAVALYREQRDSIRLCIFDVIMPKKNGWEAFADIVAICPDARGLFMSGYQADTVRLQDLAAKGSGFIAKPVVPRELLSRIRELLDS